MTYYVHVYRSIVNVRIHVHAKLDMTRILQLYCVWFDLLLVYQQPTGTGAQRGVGLEAMIRGQVVRLVLLLLLLV